MEAVDRTPNAKCVRCNCPYGSHGFHDLMVPNDVWEKISPTGGHEGLLCPTCIIAAMDEAGMKNVPVYFASGPASIKPTVEAEQFCNAWTDAKGKLERILEIITGSERSG